MNPESLSLSNSGSLFGSTERIPVSVLTGFLGSGKTTVLNHLTEQAAFGRTLILINEFGEIGLDHDLVSYSNDEVIVEMASGCLCCTIRGDLAKVLGEAPWRFSRDGQRWFDRVLIETTGLADPAPILHTLMTDDTVVSQYRLDGVITTVDAVNAGTTFDRQIESVKQAAVADRLLLTKTDLVDANALQDLQERLRQMAPTAPQIVAKHGMVDPDQLLDAGLYNPRNKSIDVQNWLNAEAANDENDHHHHGHHLHDVNRHGDHIKAHSVALDEPIPGAVFDLWLETLISMRGEDILRVKGIINIAELDAPMVVHGVQHIFHPPVLLNQWPSADRRSRLVFITRDLEESILLDLLRGITSFGTVGNLSDIDGDTVLEQAS